MDVFPHDHVGERIQLAEEHVAQPVAGTDVCTSLVEAVNGRIPVAGLQLAQECIELGTCTRSSAPFQVRPSQRGPSERYPALPHPVDCTPNIRVVSAGCGDQVLATVVLATYWASRRLEFLVVEVAEFGLVADPFFLGVVWYMAIAFFVTDYTFSHGSSMSVRPKCP